MIENLKDLEKLIKLCQKQGIDSIKIGTLELKLGTPPTPEPKKRQGIPMIDPMDSFTRAIIQDSQIDSSGWDALSDEEKLFYSAGKDEQ